MSDQITINSRKFDGRISKTWHAELTQQDDTILIFTGVFETAVDHRKLGYIRKGTVSREYYWTDKWYNVFRFIEPEGELRNYYCNVATPPTFEDGILDYIDLDIDVLADANLNYEVLDLDEFEERRVTLGYTPEIIERSKRSLDELIRLLETRQFPFDT